MKMQMKEGLAFNGAFLRDGWECKFVPIIAGTVSVGESEWGKSIDALGIAMPKAQDSASGKSSCKPFSRNAATSSAAQMHEEADHIDRQKSNPPTAMPRHAN